jgi:hypothetical protein
MPTTEKTLAPVLLIVASLGALGYGVPAAAHHSGAQFDMVHCKSLTGTVRTLEWQYPHNWLWIDVKDDNGGIVPWGFEFMSPTQAKAIDPLWAKDVMKKGDKVTVTFGPLKDGRSGGALASVTIPDGHVLGASPGLCRPPGLTQA